MSKPVTNTAYRKSRGTDKPFSGSEEQAKAIWAALIQREKWTPAPRTPAAKPTPKKGASGN